MDDTADASEHPGDEGGEFGWEGWRVDCDHSHGFPDQRCGVGHHAHERACVFRVVGGVVVAIEDAAHLFDGDTSADGDEELAG